MTQASADKIANVVIGAAAVGAAVYLARNPRLRRVAWKLAVATLTGTVPAWLKEEVRTGWHESAAPGGTQAMVQSRAV